MQLDRPETYAAWVKTRKPNPELAGWRLDAAVRNFAAQLTPRNMPKKTAIRRARRDARAGKKPTTQAGEFVREEMHELKKGSGNVRSRKQAIAIGLSEARRSGVKVPAPKQGRTSSSTRRKANRDLAVGQGKAKPSPTRSRGAKKAARTRARKSR